MRLSNHILIGLITLSLLSCGGSDGSDNESNITTPQPPTGPTTDIGLELTSVTLSGTVNYPNAASGDLSIEIDGVTYAVDDSTGNWEAALAYDGTQTPTMLEVVSKYQGEVIDRSAVTLTTAQP